MKKITALIALLILVAGGYSGLWYKNTQLLKNEIESGVNLSELFLGSDAITYTSLDSAGFPSSVAVKFYNLKINLLNVYKLETDNLQIGRGIFNNSILYNSSAITNFEIGPFTPDASPLKLVYKSKGINHFGKVTFSGSNLADFIKVNMSFYPFKEQTIRMNLIDNFKSYEARTDGGELSAPDTGEVYYATGPSHVRISLDRIDENSQKASLLLSVEDQEFTPAADKAIKELLNSAIISSALSDTEQFRTIDLNTINLSARGKSSYNIDISYEGVTKLDRSNEAPFELTINQMKSTNALQSGTLEGHIKGILSKENKLEELNTRVRGTFKASNEFDQYLKTIFLDQLKAQFLSEKRGLVSADPSERTQIEQEALINHLASYIDIYGKRILPDIQTFGEIVYNIDFKYDSSKGIADIKEIALKTKKGGVSLEGHINHLGKENLKYDLNIRLLNYEEFLNSLVEYSLHLTEVYKDFYQDLTGEDFVQKFSHQDTRPKLIAIKEQIIQSGKTDGNDLLIPLSNDSDQAMIGEIPAAMFMLLVLNIFSAN